MAKGYFFTGVLALNNNGEISLFEIKPKKKTHGTNVSIYLVTHDIPPIPVTRDDVIRVAFYLENSVGTTPVRIKMAEATFYGNLIETKPQITDGLSLRTEGAEWQFSKMYTGGIAPGAGVDAATSTSTTAAPTATTTTTTTTGPSPVPGVLAAGAVPGAPPGLVSTLSVPGGATGTTVVVGLGSVNTGPTPSTSVTGSGTTTGAVVGGSLSSTAGTPLASSVGTPGVGTDGLLSMSSGSVTSIPGALSPAIGPYSDVATSTPASSSSSAYSGYSACSLSSSAGSSAASSASSSSSSSSTSSIASLQPFTWFLSGITARVPDQRAKEYLSLSRG